MHRTTVFKSNGMQAVRFSNEVAFPEEGQRRIIVPDDAGWNDFFESPGIDLGERKQPTAKNRDGAP